MAEELIVPPIQQSLEDTGSARDNGIDLPLTAKNWYLYWQRTGQLVNLHSRLIAQQVTYGLHEERPDPGILPAGALYMETDRSDVIYQAIDGHWQYLAGTMWGTITPDERPTDLGVYDGGFHFRGTDDAREFLWSQTAWVEVTSARYGTHAARLATSTTAAEQGMLWIETDRGNVVYQNQAGNWVYVTGSMWGTLSPDQRPTDLGTHDYGFDFRDSANAPFREYVWNGSAWSAVNFPAGAPQTPWTSNIDAANHSLLNVSAIGVKMSNPQTLVSLGSSISTVKLALYDPGAGNGPVYGIGVNSGQLTFGVGIAPTGTPQMILDALGSLGLGVSPGYRLHLATDSAAKPSTNTWTVASDIRLKQNVRPLEGGLDVINRLEPIVSEYNGKAGTPKDGRVVSLDAAKLRAILPHAVSSVKGKLDPEEAEETDILGVNTHEILYHLVLAVQQLCAEAKSAKAKAERLKP